MGFLVVLVIVAILVFFSFVGYKWKQCKYIFSFPFSCSIPRGWTDNTSVSGYGDSVFTGSSQSDCQQKCMNDSTCKVAFLDKALQKCVLFSLKPEEKNCTETDPNKLMFQKSGGVVPPACPVPG